MSYASKKRKNQARSLGRTSLGRTGRFVRLEHFLLESPAWKSLDAVARAVYVDMAKRYAGPGTNNGRLIYSVRQAAEELHISTATASRALKRLQERGFAVIQSLGAFSLKSRHATEWRLTDYPCDVSNQPATKDFMRWGLEKQNTVSLVKPNGISGETVARRSAA